MSIEIKDKSNKSLMDLPGEWWRYKPICQLLSNWFIGHLLGLFLSVKIEDQTRHGLYTGFLLYHREHLLWVTAGHVIDEIEKILSNPSISVLRMRWLDRYEIPGGESIPSSHRDLKMFSTSTSGVDFGVAIIAGLDSANIQKNDRVKIMTEQVWKNLHLARPEGYYVLGYPQEWFEAEEHRLTDNRVSGSARAKLACLPVTQIEYRGPHPTKKFWNDPEAFYGQILPFPDDQDQHPQNIAGMSGGPLFSLERDPSERIRYRLFGIQHSWDRDERLIRVEPIHRIIDMIDK